MPVGRPREFDQQEALEAAMRVFWTRGYESTSLEDLLQAMGIARSSFYQAFRSKPELFQKCLECYRDQSAGQLIQSLARSTTAWDFIRSTLEGVADGTGKDLGRAGCLLMNTATEFGQRDPAVSDTVGDAMRRMQEVFATALDRAKAEGSVSKETDTASQALFLATNLGGLKAMARAGAPPAAIRSVVEIALRALR